jgi:hypothetical protein
VVNVGTWPTRRVARGLTGIGGAAVATAVAWWGLLFPTVVANTGLTFGEALPCVVSNSQLCELETTLCGAGHWLGIKSYSPTLFWCGAALLSVSLLLTSLRPAPRR